MNKILARALRISHQRKFHMGLQCNPSSQTQMSTAELPKAVLRDLVNAQEIWSTPSEPSCSLEAEWWLIITQEQSGGVMSHTHLCPHQWIHKGRLFSAACIQHLRRDWHEWTRFCLVQKHWVVFCTSLSRRNKMGTTALNQFRSSPQETASALVGWPGEAAFWTGNMRLMEDIGSLEALDFLRLSLSGWHGGRNMGYGSWEHLYCHYSFQYWG